jgi:glutamate---cysteine ligase / carboxylate-amine ligase
MSEGQEGEEVLVGVEEEFLLVDVESRLPAPRISRVIDDAVALAGDQAQEELHRAQIELATSPNLTLGELQDDLLALRTKMVEAASNHGAAVVAAATYPDAMGESGRLITEKDRYEEMAEANSMLAREQLICGCHVHVTVPEPDQAVRLMNRIRRWLPCLLALTTNSPYWEGEDSGFSSYRTEVWTRWPTAGPTGEFESAAAYEAMMEQLVASGVIVDKAMAYWDVRPSERFPTLEIRIADVMPSIDEVVMYAGLVRALVGWCGSDTEEWPPIRRELLQAANWRAARSGLSGVLIDPADGSQRPARQAITELLERLQPELSRRGEWTRVTGAVEAIFDRGTGADRQRRAYARRHLMADVIDLVTLQADGQPAMD